MIPARRHVVGMLASAVVAAGVVACGPGTAPAGQPPMVLLTAQTLETVRQEFNQASDRSRVILLLSPT